jgi:small subunit ribosomal protein S2
METQAATPSVNLKNMLDAGVHFGHQTQRWNPKMKPYVFTARGGIHIIDLQKSLEMAKKAAKAVESIAAQGGKMIFVGTKKQAMEPIKEAATRAGQFYVTKRWLGGMLTNFQTIKNSIDRMRKIEKLKETGDITYFSKKEQSKIDKEYIRLVDYLEGIRDMKEAPVCMFVIDINKEHIAVAEAKTLGIPVVAIADTNTDPETIDYPIPGNDDAIRSIKLFCDMISDSFMAGAARWEDKMREIKSKEDVEAVEIKPKVKEPAPSKPASAGPAVVMVSKRKLVAAGTADEVEIAEEIERGETTEFNKPVEEETETES